MDRKRLQVYPKSQAIDQVSPGAHHSLIVRRFLQKFSVRASERWKEGLAVVYSKGATVAFHIRVSYSNASVRTLHLGACPHLTCIPRRSRRSLCCSAPRIKLQVVDSRCANHLYRHSCFHDVSATLTTTYNPHRFLLPVFVMYFAMLRLNHLLLSKSTHRSLTARNIRSQVSGRRRERCMLV